jgi:WD40 repeat protein
MADPQPADPGSAAPVPEQLTIIEPRGGRPDAGPTPPERAAAADTSFTLQTPPAEPGAQPLHRLGDYELLQEVGRGGMGVVFKARHVRLGRIVALKMILGGALAKPEDLQRFNTEAAAAAQLQHPGIVALYEAGTIDNQPYFSMEFVEGSSLSQLVSHGTLPGRRAAAYLEKVARAVAYAHRRGIIHRDLKPANILVDDTEQPKITDFGLAKVIQTDSGQTRTGTVIGTPSYMSPEQASARKDLGPASDIYSVGAILYELITGTPPFRGETALATLTLVAETDPPAPRSLNREIDVDLETICLKCLAKEPSRRYATADDLANDLRRYVEGEAITARPVSRIERALIWCRRKPTAAALLAVSAAAVLAIFTGTLAFAILQSEQAEEERHLRKEAERLQHEAEKSDRLAQERLTGMSWLMYLAEMRQAQQAFDAANLDRSRELLKKYRSRPELRDWEWYYLWELTHGRFTLDGHDGRATAVAYRGDGLRLATAGGPPQRPSAVKIWDARTGALLHTLSGHTNRVTGVAWSPDGRLLVTSSYDKSVRVWDAEAGKLLATLTGHAERVTGVAMHPSGKLLASGDGEGQLRLWKLDGVGEPGYQPQPVAWAAHKGEIGAVAFSPDKEGRWLASGGASREIKIWETATHSPVRAFPAASEPPDRFRPVPLGPIKSLAFSPDGKLLVSGGGLASKGGEVFVWDPAAGELRHAFTGLNDVIGAVAISPQGHLAAGCNDGLIRLWLKPRADLPYAGEPLRIRADAQGVYALAFNGNGRRLATAGHDGRIRTWGGTGGQESLTLPAAPASEVVAFSRDGKLVVASVGPSVGPAEIRAWDLHDPSKMKQMLKCPAAVVALALNAEGTLAAVACDDKELRLFELSGTATEPRLLDPRPPGKESIYRPQVKALAFSPDGRRLATAEDEKVRLWDVAAGTVEQVLEGHTNYILALAFSPDGKYLVTGAVDSTVRLWDLSDGSHTVLGKHDNSVKAVAFSYDGRLVASAGIDRQIRLWKTSTRSLERTLEGSAGGVLTLTFHPDGRRLASAGEDRVVRLWDLVTGQEVLELEGSAGQVKSIAFSGDGRWLGAAGQHPALRLWEAPRPPRS